MTKKSLLDTLKEFTETVTKNVILPCALQEGDEEQTFRAADVYLMRLLASGNIWELSATSSDEAGGKRFSVKLRFTVCDGVLSSRFELCDPVDLAAYEATRREIAFLPDRTKNR